MNPHLQQLQPYPFQRLAKLKEGISPPPDKLHISLSIGEPKHTSPEFVNAVLRENFDKLTVYPNTRGIPELRQAIGLWLENRFKLNAGSIDPETQVLPVNGTREALFSFAQAVIDSREQPVVISPNPFYQIYEGAAYLAGAQPRFLPCTEATDFVPDFSRVEESVWQRCQLLYLCSPGNPTGAVIDIDTMKTLIGLADRYDFIIASDECYSELYADENNPPPGLLQACNELGRNDYRRCVVFHSLSKRSNLPGLRSGFVAGDARILESYFLYRTYHGCAMPLHNQLASVAAWSDEEHVRENRILYNRKFDAVLTELDGCLDVTRPTAAFYLWPKTPLDDTEFARRLFAEQNLTVLPGQFLSRTADGANPGENRVRLALVAEPDECVEAARRIKAFMQSL